MLAAFLLAAAVAPAPPGTTASELALPAFGYRDGATITGTNPRFDLYVPDYRSARKMTARFALRFPPQVDGDTLVTVRVDGRPVGSATVASLRGGGTVSGAFEEFRGTGRMLDVSVETYLTVSGRPCEDYDPRSLWMRVEPASSVTVERATAKPATVAEFFEDYDGRYAVDLAAGASDTARLDALALAYWLNQIERWRQVHLAFLPQKQDGRRRIVVGEGSRDLAVRDGVLYATPHGIELIAARAAQSAVSPEVQGVVAVHSAPPRSPVSLEALGIGTRTQRGAGELSFPVSFALAAFGGLPQGLHFHAELSHGPYLPGDRATVTVMLNGAVVNGFTLSSTGKTERLDVPLDDRQLSGANQLVVAVEYVPGHQACAGGRPSLAVSLLGSSWFAWRGVAAYPPAIGEFFNESSGTAGVGISNAALDPYAFEVLDRLGKIDPHVARFELQRYAGVRLEGVTEAVYVAAPGALGDLPAVFDASSGELELTNDAGKTVYRARLDTPYGLIQALRETVPTLLVTYAKAPSALDSLAAVPTAELSSARYDVLLFNERGIAYTNPGEIVLGKRSAPAPVRTSWPLVAAFAAIVVVALVLIARRARRVS